MALSGRAPSNDPEGNDKRRLLADVWRRLGRERDEELGPRNQNTAKNNYPNLQQRTSQKEGTGNSRGLHEEKRRRRLLEPRSSLFLPARKTGLR